MPWCTGCDRFLSPSTVTPAGRCPRCDALVEPGRGRAADASPDPAPPAATGAVGPDGADAPGAHVVPDPGPSPAAPVTAPGADDRLAGDDETPLPVPWHFKLLVGAIALYLGWRAFQGIEWLVHRL